MTRRGSIRLAARGLAAAILLIAIDGAVAPVRADDAKPPVPEVRVPSREYVICVHYDLGMHCTGFDFSYCCILPPYNSVLAQIVRTASSRNEKPKVLKETDLTPQGLVLWYFHENNTYSEGPKMLYWNLPDDTNRDGDLSDPGDSYANTTWRHLFTYAEAPLRFRPYPTGLLTKRYLGIDLPIPQDHGPTGKPLSFGKLDYTGPEGTVLYTTTNDGETETPLVLAQREYWEALGLPLTPFEDGAIGNIRLAREEKIRPYQRAVVTLSHWKDENDDGIAQIPEVTPADDPRSHEPVRFFGTNPIDVPGCQRCHASERSNGTKYTRWKKEYRYWKDRHPNTTDYYASIKAASISLLEIHDDRHGTDFLANYDPDDLTGASVTRLGRPPVRCQDCHADNVVGQLRGSTPEGKKQAIASLSASLHLAHLRNVPDPDVNGRTTSCQGCHPAHQQSGRLDDFPLDEHGRFRGGDIRDYHGGCFLGRDLHGAPATPPGAPRPLGTRPHLNAIGQWMLANVKTGKHGLYCTNCHNVASRLLYKADTLTNALTLEGTTLRTRPLDEMIAAFRKMEGGRYADFTVEDFLDPKVPPSPATPEALRDDAHASGSKPRDSKPGDTKPGDTKAPAVRNAVAAVWTDPPSDPYRVVDDGGDYWLAAGEPRCSDCHLPPFVESMGGTYAPIDQIEKPSLMRYSKGHQGISCQACHQSMHGLYPVAKDGADPTTRAQALLLDPEGKGGPLRCVVCHAVDHDGVPFVVDEKKLAAFPDAQYPTRYEKAVALAHTARTFEEMHGPGR